MPGFKPILRAEQLPQPGDGYERPTLDFKAKLNLSKPANIAIDVAAFANHLGGSLIIGAAEQDGHVGSYIALTPDEAEKQKDGVSKAVADRCLPKPRFDVVPVPIEGGQALVVNVWPQLNGVVAVRITDHRRHIRDLEAVVAASGHALPDAIAEGLEGYGGPSWIFPVRTGSDAYYITPENLPMYMLPQTRRIAVLLSQIPEGSEVTCVVLAEGGTKVPRTFHGFDEERNAVMLSSPTKPHWVPLDAIARLFCDEEGRWKLLFEGKYDFYK